jgi:hypothetical protein
MKTPTPLRIALFAITASALALGPPIPRARAGFAFTKIADSSTPVPGGSGTFGG